MLKEYLPFYKRLLKIAFPLVLTQAGQMSVQLIDNAMVGRVGTAELAAASFANSIFVIIMVFGLGILLGLTPLISHSLGSGDEKIVAYHIKNGFILTLIAASILTLVTFSLTAFMPYMGQSEDVVRLAIPYFKTLAISLIPLLLFIFLKQTGEGFGNTILAMYATLIANLINIVLNYLLIYGKFGFPELGLLGAGYATLISRVAAPIILFICFRKVSPINHFIAISQKIKASKEEVLRIFKLGLPIAGQLVLEVSAFAIGAIMMGWLGSVPLAAHQVAMGMASFTFMLANGVAQASTIRVSFQLGQKDYDSMEKVSFSAVHIVVVYMGICGVMFFTLRNILPMIFTTDPVVIKQAASLLMMAALFQLFDGLQVVSLGILRGFKDVNAPMLIAGISYLIIGLPISYVFAFVLGFGPEGIWFGFVSGLISAAILLSFRIQKKIREVEANGLLKS